MGLLLVCAAIVGVRAGLRYARARISDELHRRIEEFVESAGGTVQLGEVRFEDSNKISVRNVLVSFHEEGAGLKTFASIPEVEVKANLLSALLRRSFPMTVTLLNPQLSLERQTDGTWKLPSIKKTLPKDEVYSVIAQVNSGRLDLKQQEGSNILSVEDINISLRSRADGRGFRVRSTFLLPSISGNPLAAEGSIYPSESRFDIRQRANALDVVALSKLIAGSPLNIEDGTIDCTLEISGVIGKSTTVQGPVEFSAFQVAGAPRLLREIDATAHISLTVNQDANGVALEECTIDAGSWGGSVSGTMSFDDGGPLVHLKGRSDDFPLNELVRTMVDERFPAVSEIRLALEREASLSIEIDGKIAEPSIDLVASCSESLAAFRVETDRYETVDVSVELAETLFRWSPTEGVSVDAQVSAGTVKGRKMPFALRKLAGLISIQNGSARTDSLKMLVDDLPVAVSGYADVSGSDVTAAEATVRCVIGDLARTRYASPLKDLNLSGPAVLISQLQKLGESVRWDIDADLTDADIRWRDVFHKPAGISARFCLSNAVPTENVSFKAYLGRSNAAGSATVGGGDTAKINSLTLESDTLYLAELAPLLKLPVEVREETGTKLALAVTAATDRPHIKVGLSADQLAVTLLDEKRTEPVQIAFEDITTNLKTDANGYQTDLRCATVRVSPAIHTLANGGYRPQYPARLTSPVRIVASIDRFLAEPCEMNQLEFEILLSESQWVLSAATGRAAGGTFELYGNMTHDKGTFSFEYACDGFDIGEVMCWMPDGAQGISGDLSARMSLSGRLGTAGLRSGKGTLTVTDGEIESSNVISRTQGSENDSEPGPIQFDTLKCDFSLDNDTINVSNLLVEKPGLLVQGRGTITLDGQVDQTFDVEISRSMAEQLSNKKRWGLLDALVGGLGQLVPLPRLTQDPIKRTFTVKGTFGSLETEVDRGPLYVELVRATFAFSESVVVSGVTVLALPARMFTDVLAWANGL